MLVRDTWDAAVALFQAMAKSAFPAMLGVVQEAGHVPPMLFVLTGTSIHEPAGITVELALRRNPYSTPEAAADRMATGVQDGLVAADSGNGQHYHLTERGRALMHAALAAWEQTIAAYPTSPAADLAAIEGALDRLVAACLAAPEPPGSYSMTLNQALDLTGPDSPPLVRIDQRLGALQSFRDDAHMAAWQPLGVSGPAWEVLTVLWHGEARTLEQIAGHLARRRLPVEIYAAALAELLHRGWIEQRGEEWFTTAAGDGVRAEAEETTDRYFYGPWALLADGELADLRERLVALRKEVVGEA